NGTQLNTNIAQQLKQVARLIEARNTLDVKRQVFFVSLGGFDTHSNTVATQTNLFNQLAPALKAFYDYTVAAGIATNVTTFTMSDFNRTFIGPAAGICRRPTPPRGHARDHPCPPPAAVAPVSSNAAYRGGSLSHCANNRAFPSNPVRGSRSEIG